MVMCMSMLGLSMLTGLGSGFAFGSGYGAGVRFGYEDVYPYLKGNMSQIANMLKIPFASSGFKLASGVTAQQGLGLKDAEGSTGGMGLTTPEATVPQVSPSGDIKVAPYGKSVRFGGVDWAVITTSDRAVNPFNGPTRYASYDEKTDSYELWVKKGDRYRLLTEVDMNSSFAGQGLISSNFIK